MSTKEEYCFRVLRKYGLLVNFDGEVGRVNVPDQLDNSDETLKQWIKRVLGPDVSNVVVYVPESLNGARGLAKLQTAVDAVHLRQVLRTQVKVKNAQAVVKVEKAVEKAQRIFSTFSKDTIQDHLVEFGDLLEPSVKDFFERQLANYASDVDAELLLKEIIKSFNDVACAYRKLAAVSPLA
jgi:hypothetical protein